MAEEAPAEIPAREPLTSASLAAESPPCDPEDVDPVKVLPVEAARAHMRHWWREPVAGLIAIGIGVFDSWVYPRDAGLTSSLDEILVIGGVVLVAGSKRLFAGNPSLIEPKKE